MVGSWVDRWLVKMELRLNSSPLVVVNLAKYRVIRGI
jgi:hypothetical protein